jgi:hypothetical protein
MTTYKKLNFNTLDALAACAAVYSLFNQQVKKPESRDAVFNFLHSGIAIDGMNDSHRKAAEDIRAIVSQRIMLAGLTDSKIKPNAFIVTLDELMQKETITNNFLSMLVWCPKVADSFTKEDDVREQVLKFGMGSGHLGQVGKKIKLTYHEITCKYLPTWNSFMHTGYDDDENLISFYNKAQFPTGSKITGRVKHHKVDGTMANSRVTGLNYIKVAK